MSVYRFLPYELDTVKRLLMSDGEIIPLTPKAFDILQLLIENRGKVLGKEVILKSVWPDTFVEEGNLTVNISTLRRLLGENQHDHKFIVTYTGRGYSFVAEVELDDGALHSSTGYTSVNSRGALTSPEPVANLIPHPVSQASIDPAGGALRIESDLYIERPVDQEFYTAITRRDSLVLVKGARQVGKTSLLARGLQLARQQGARVVVTDLQNLNADYLESIDRFFLGLAEEIADQLDLETRPRAVWNDYIGPSSNFERYWRREILGRIDSNIIWGLDEVDRLFGCPFGSEVFGLFRSWHNKRALEPEGPWQRLTLVISYAIEAHLFITDLNQSPFNVGTRLSLNDFTMSQIEMINRRYGSPIKSREDLERLFSLVGGHPYLVNRTFWEMSTHGVDINQIYDGAALEESIYSDHLHRLLHSLRRNDELRESVKEVMSDRGCPTVESFYRLRSAGILQGASPGEAAIRCKLYRLYLQDRL